MIDLHCHILPGMDDGAGDVGQALEMARMAADDGISVIACTPHISADHRNDGTSIREAVSRLQEAIDAAGIAIRLIPGADNHLTPSFVDDLRAGRMLGLGDSQYVLVEPPHHVAPPGLDAFLFSLLAAGYVPVITHPERLGWMETNYRLIERLARSGVFLQITAGSLTGRFGRRVRSRAERLLDDGLVHLLATDAHNTSSRPPILSKAYELVAARLGREEADNLVLNRPSGVLNRMTPARLPGQPVMPRMQERVNLFRRVFART